MEFTGRTCIVTGAARGMGFAIAKKYAENGANVVMMDVNEALLKESAKKVDALGDGTVLPMAVDISKTENINKAMATVEEKLGAVYALVNCAGISLYTPMLEYTEKDWDTSFDICLKGLFFLSQAAAKNMVKYGIKGKIVSFSSQAGKIGEPGGCAYDSAKAGVAMLTQCMALDLAKYGISCTAVAPGMVNTEMIQAYLARDCVNYGMTKEEFEAKRMEGIPFGRMGEPSEVAELVYFLSSDRGAYITGETINFTGGSCNI